MSQELFRIDRDYAVNCNPGGRLHGWLFKLHADNETWVSVRKLDDIAPSLHVTLAYDHAKVTVTKDDLRNAKDKANG